MNPVVIRRSGNLLELPEGGRHEGILYEKLTYTHRVSYHGAELIARKRYVKATGANINPKMDFVDQPLYQVVEGRLICPAGLRTRIEEVFRLHKIPTVYEDLRTRKWVPMDFTRLLEVPGGLNFKYKQDLVLATIDGEENGVIVAPTGYGKSFLAKLICKCCPKAKIVFVSPGVDLIRGLYQPLMELVHDVGRVGDGYCQTGRRVTLASMDSLHRCDLSSADLIIADEVHEAASPTRQRGFSSQFTEAKMIGLTASPYRGDGAWDVIESLFGPIRLRIEYDEAVQHDAVRAIRVLMVEIPPFHGYRNGYDDTAWLRHAYWRNDIRNQVIAMAVRQLVPQYSAVADPQILVMVDKVDHAYHLRKYLPEFQLVYGNLDDEDRIDDLVKRGLMVDGEETITSKRRDSLRVAFEKQELKYAIATKVWSRGVNFVNLPVFVRADGGQGEVDSIQMPGRLSRVGEVDYGLLLDFIDTYDPKAMKRSTERQRAYRRMGWPIQKATVNYSGTP